MIASCDSYDQKLMLLMCSRLAVKRVDGDEFHYGFTVGRKNISTLLHIIPA